MKVAKSFISEVVPIVPELLLLEGDAEDDGIVNGVADGEGVVKIIGAFIGGTKSFGNVGNEKDGSTEGFAILGVVLVVFWQAYNEKDNIQSNTVFL